MDGPLLGSATCHRHHTPKGNNGVQGGGSGRGGLAVPVSTPESLLWGSRGVTTTFFHPNFSFSLMYSALCEIVWS